MGEGHQRRGAEPSASPRVPGEAAGESLDPGEVTAGEGFPSLVSGRVGTPLPACGACHHRTAAGGLALHPVGAYCSGGHGYFFIYFDPCRRWRPTRWALGKAGQREQRLAFWEPLIVGWFPPPDVSLQTPYWLPGLPA